MLLEGAVPRSDPRADGLVRRRNVSWQAYLAAMAKRGEGSVPRMSYLEGELQLMTPSLDHDGIARRIGFLVDIYCLDHDVPCGPFGSWTVKDQRVLRGVEADECYIFGARRARPLRPDLSIEVIWTSGSIDKLAVYRLLRVREVWMWILGEIQVHRLHGSRYRRRERSGFLPDLDLGLVAELAAQTRATINQLARELRAAIRRTKRKTRSRAR